MKRQLYVIDNFYTNPDEVREYALKREFNVFGNYPGARTEPESEQQSEYLKTFFEDNIVHRKITYWPREYNTAFQYTDEESSTWIHHDQTQWAGVLYLTPNPPRGYGTTMYRHKGSGILEHEPGLDDYNESSEQAGDLSLWHKEMEIENCYNRLVLYNGLMYHRSTTPGFGNSPETGRLFQTFFFDME